MRDVEGGSSAPEDSEAASGWSVLFNQTRLVILLVTLLAFTLICSVSAWSNESRRKDRNKFTCQLKTVVFGGTEAFQNFCNAFDARQLQFNDTMPYIKCAFRALS